MSTESQVQEALCNQHTLEARLRDVLNQQQKLLSLVRGNASSPAEVQPGSHVKNMGAALPASSSKPYVIGKDPVVVAKPKAQPAGSGKHVISKPNAGSVIGRRVPPKARAISCHLSLHALWSPWPDACSGACVPRSLVCPSCPLPSLLQGCCDVE
eukprot:1472931-Amphidinium_carterae.1